MFMQAHSRPGRKGGLGLGLTLARNLVERHGGRLTARSEGLERGTEFTIRLPLPVDAISPHP
jgi:signal transduction histidine kinase